jgi:hypothetical protein
VGDLLSVTYVTNYLQGVYAINTVALYQALDVGFFRVWGAIYSGFIILLWALFFCRTIASVPHGKIFEAPYLKELEMGGESSEESLEDLYHSG